MAAAALGTSPGPSGTRRARPATRNSPSIGSLSTPSPRMSSLSSMRSIPSLPTTKSPRLAHACPKASKLPRVSRDHDLIAGKRLLVNDLEAYLRAIPVKNAVVRLHRRRSVALLVQPVVQCPIGLQPVFHTRSQSRSKRHSTLLAPIPTSWVRYSSEKLVWLSSRQDWSSIEVIQRSDEIGPG